MLLKPGCQLLRKWLMNLTSSKLIVFQCLTTSFSNRPEDRTKHDKPKMLLGYVVFPWSLACTCCLANMPTSHVAASAWY